MNRTKHTLQFIEMFLTLIKGNTSLIDTLYILSRAGINPDIKRTSDGILANMKKGKNFSDSLGMLPRNTLALNSVYIELIKASEATGTIEVILENIMKDLRRKQQSNQNMMSVMIYPLFIIAIALLGTIVIIYKGIPLFSGAGFLSDETAASAAGGIITSGIFLLSSGALLFFIYYRIFGKDSSAYQIFYLLSFLLQGNILLPDALSLCITTAGETRQGRILVRIKKEIAGGGSFSRAFARSNYFASYVIGWLKVAEKNGNIAEACRNISDYYQRRDGKTRDYAIKCIEPVVIVITGIYILILMQGAILPILTHAGGIF